MNMFKSGMKFKSAVQLSNQKQLLQKSIIEFENCIKKNQILLQSQLRILEVDLISKFHSGYSYAFDVDEEHLNNFNKIIKQKNGFPEDNYDTIVKDLFS